MGFGWTEHFLLEHVPYILAGLIMLFVSGALLVMGWRHRANRHFATLLALIALGYAISNWNDVTDYRYLPEVYLGNAVLGSLSTAAAVMFVGVYPRPRGWLGRSRVAPLVVYGLAAALTLVMLAAPHLVATWGPRELRWGGLVRGPLSAISIPFNVIVVVLVVLLARDWLRAPSGPFRRSTLIVFLGLALWEILWSIQYVVNDLGGRMSGTPWPTAIDRAEFVTFEWVGVLPLLATLAILRHARRTADEEARRQGTFVAALILGLAAAVVALSLATPPPPTGSWYSSHQILVDGLASMALPLFIGYALVKHKLFDIDVKVRWTISRGTVAAVFVAAFFIVAEIAENLLDDSLGWAMGGIAAGLLLFAIAPIQRLAERVASAAMPGVGARTASTRQSEIYRLAVSMALADRVVSRDEEKHLAKLAEELGLTHTQAMDLRHAVETEMGLAS